VNIREVLGIAPVIPAVTIHRLEHAIPLARALSAGGLRVIEIALRTPAALGAIEAVRAALPQITIGAGMLTRPIDFAAAGRVGAQFGVSPGLTPELAAAARGARFPLLPGAMTPTEVIAARNAGFSVLQFFPAEQCGGVEMLQSLVSHFPDITFHPAPVSRAAAPRYLALAGVVSVGGTWLVPQTMLDVEDWAGIEALAREAAALRHRS
jgi:2-dehydro-3-deoxyphosphogluconate aldolase/(4S)-4-hydroxy-2-oxoglutarate aldolase